MKPDEPFVRLPHGLSRESMLTELIRNLYNYSIMLMDYEGRIHCANDTVMRGFKIDSAEDIYLKSYRDFAPDEWADERIRLVQHVIDTGERTTMLEIFSGFKVRSRIRHIPADGDTSTKGYALVTIEQIDAKLFEAICSKGQLDGLSAQESVVHARIDNNIVHAEYIDLGKLDVLTAREIEILALIGQGHRAREIASELYRSVKTVESHTENIKQKLGVTDRVALAKIAHAAVLRVEDAYRKRVQMSRLIPKSS